MLTRIKPFLPGIALVIVLLALFFILNNGGEREMYSDTDPAFNAAYWKQEMDLRGPQAAYASFRERNGQAPFARQHFSAHVVGEMLAEELGIEGIPVCDASFGFGCYHGYFGRLIAERGTSSITELDAKCVEAFGPLGTGCLHGIGHGILEYVGYDQLNEGLRLCEMTTVEAPLLGCSAGVFMEYHARLGESTAGYVPEGRAFDPADPYNPCLSVREQDSDACYYGLGLWYRTEFGTNYQQMGSLCSGLSGTARTHCFLGIGTNTSPLEGYSLTAALSACATFSAEDELTCRAGASWGFFSDPVYRELADDACAYPDEDKETECLALADLTLQNTRP
jgi:hypothetical protein